MTVTKNDAADDLGISSYQSQILLGLQKKQVYQGFSDDSIVTYADGSTETIPDPRIARVDRWRRRNKAARKSRRINRIAGQR